MRPIKKSSSGLLLTENINLIKLGLINKGPSVAYNKNQEKADRIEFELEKQKDIIVKLQQEINEKDKELNLILKHNKIQKNKFQKTIKIIEQVLKLCEEKKENEIKIELDDKNDIKHKTITNNNFDHTLYSQNSKDNFKTINNLENDNDTDNYNKTNIKTFYTTNNNYNTKEKSLPKIKSQKNKLTINTQFNFNKVNKFKENTLYVNTLRSRIGLLNTQIGKKYGEINSLKINTNTSSYSKLQEDFLSNYNKLSEIKQKNISMLSKLDDISENFFFAKDENYNLKIKLNEFQEKFYNYKKNIKKKNIELKNKLEIYEEKNTECIFSHLNIGNLSKYNRNRSKLSEVETLNDITNKEINEFEKEIKNKNGDIKYINKEIDKLNIEKKELIEKNSDLNIKIKNLEDEKEILNKKNKELTQINKEIKSKLKEKENEYINEIYKIGDIKIVINNKDKEIEELKKEILNLRNSKNI